MQRVETIRLAPYQQEELAEMVSELPTPSGNDDELSFADVVDDREHKFVFIEWSFIHVKLWKTLNKKNCWTENYFFESFHQTSFN